ncbi:MAG: hypothetical protein GY861_26225 [bacterium]|nr:hypothetical protein [bacterium]
MYFDPNQIDPLIISRGHPYQKKVDAIEVMDFTDFIEKCGFTEHKVHQDKFDFSLRSYHACAFTNGEKIKKEAGDLWILAIDIDNKAEFTHKLTAQEVQEKLMSVKIKKDRNGFDMNGIRHFIYSTHSHTEEVPRFRVLIPLSACFTTHRQETHVDHDSYIAAYYFIRSLLNNHESIDTAVSNVSQSFNCPSCSPANKDSAFILHGGAACLGQFSVDNFYEAKKAHETKRSISSSKSIRLKGDYSDGFLIDQQMHRRERLLKIVFAEYMSGSLIDDAIEQVHAFDQQMHDEPHFEKTRYGNKDPFECAVAFVESEWKIISRKFEQPEFDREGVEKLFNEMCGSFDTRDPEPPVQPEKADFKPKNSTFRLIPHGTKALAKIHKAELRLTKKGVLHLYLDFKILEGEHEKRHVWQRFYFNADNEVANAISRDLFTQLLSSINLDASVISFSEKPKSSTEHIEVPELAGYETGLVVKLKKSTGNYRDTNEVQRFMEAA